MWQCLPKGISHLHLYCVIVLYCMKCAKLKCAIYSVWQIEMCWVCDKQKCAVCVSNWNVTYIVCAKLKCAVYSMCQIEMCRILYMTNCNVPYMCQSEMCRIYAKLKCAYMCQLKCPVYVPTELCRICAKLNCAAYVTNWNVAYMCQTVLTLRHLHCLCRICVKLYLPCATCTACAEYVPNCTHPVPGVVAVVSAVCADHAATGPEIEPEPHVASHQF